MSKVVWQPSESMRQHSAMRRFMQVVNDEHGLQLGNYADLYRWSVQHTEQFWEAVWRYCDIISSQPWEAVLQAGEHMINSRWFAGSRLNFAENLLRYCDTHPDDHPAVIFHGEDRVKRELSYGDLYQQVSQLAVALKALGVQPGDRVAGFMPNMPETIVAMLAATSLGAIWSSCSPDFGFNGVLDRFGQIAPKILFTADGYTFKGKAIDSLATVTQLADSIESLQAIVVVPYLADKPDISRLPGARLFSDALAAGHGATLTFAQLPFDHPLYIMYSSGTTGIPKCIVHGAGGTLVQHLKELVLHTDLHPGERLFYFTTCGWMMWNWMVTGLAAGATLVLYDGSPFHPAPEALMNLIDETAVNVFGTSAKYIAALEKTGVKPAASHRLAGLRAILSTGSPLAPESFDYVYRDVKPDVQLASISGGTDIISCFALGCPLLPVHRGELQCRGLGMKVEIFNDNGQAVRNEKGELVCTAPFPSMPVGFWNDEDNNKYRAAYFERFDNVWAHGDYAQLTDHDGLIIYGRSDAVLNPGGVRIGTAEIYRQVEKLPEIMESIAVGQDWENDVRVVLFVKLRDGTILDDEMRNRIRKVIRDNTTPRHVPAKIIAVADIPRTISGKIVELAVRKVIHHQPVTNTDALANPEALNYFRNLPELETA
jgi:acetoacetyl-CoA synthetase